MIFIMLVDTIVVANLKRFGPDAKKKNTEANSVKRRKCERLRTVKSICHFYLIQWASRWFFYFLFINITE